MKLALAIALLSVSCGGALPASLVPRPFGEDLIAIVPTGAEVIVDVDLSQLRVWEPMDKILALLPPAAQARLQRLGDHWMNEIDGLVVASWRGDRGAETILVMRGDLDDAKLAALIEPGADGAPPPKGQLYGRLLYETDKESVLRLAPRVSVTGTPVDIRRVADCVRGDLPSVRDAPADKLMRQAIAAAPTAKVGRPAVIGGAVGGPLLQDRLKAAGVVERAPQWAALAVAAGDGIDAVLVLGMATASDATGLRDQLDHSLRDLKTRPVVRILKLEELFDVAMRVNDKVLRLAYRVSGAQLSTFLLRMDEGKRALETMRHAH